MTRREDARQPAREREPSQGSQAGAGAAPERRGSPRGDGEAPVLPDRAGEDRPETWGERLAPEDDDERYLRDRPPHW